MEVSNALLCDFAQVREGLLFVSSAGITRLWRDELPAAMGVMLALVVEIDAVEARVPHELHVRVVDEDGGEVAAMQAGFQLAPMAGEALAVGERMLVPMPFDLRNVGLVRYGAYDLTIYIDNQHRRTINVWCYPPPA